MTPDAAASKKFYPAVTGWSTEEWDKADYTMWTAGGVPLGGMNPITPEQSAQGVKPHWLAYVIVDDVESSANKVRSLGGQVMHGPEDIPDIGRYAIIRDPQGAMLAIYKSNNPSPGFDGTPSLGKFTWHELMTTDHKAAFDFYRQLFGWEKTSEMDMGPTGTYLMYGQKGKPFGGLFTRPPDKAQMPPSWFFYVGVKDVNKAIDTTRRNGGRITVEPMQVPGGDWIAMMTDPQGAHFAVHQVKAKTAAAPKAKTKAKAKVKAKTQAKSKAKVRAKSKTAKARAKARPKARSKARPKARTKARPRARAKKRKSRSR